MRITGWNCSNGCPTFYLEDREGVIPTHCPYCGISNSNYTKMIEEKNKKEEWENSDISKWFKRKVGKL